MNLNLNGMVSMWKVRELVDKATNIVMNYTETEAKVVFYIFVILIVIKLFEIPHRGWPVLSGQRDEQRIINGES